VLPCRGQRSRPHFPKSAAILKLSRSKYSRTHPVIWLFTATVNCMHLTDCKSSLHLVCDLHTILQLEPYISAIIVTKKRNAEKNEQFTLFAFNVFPQVSSIFFKNNELLFSLLLLASSLLYPSSVKLLLVSPLLLASLKLLLIMLLQIFLL
jgi:hypothetical protein